MKDKLEYLNNLVDLHEALPPGSVALDQHQEAQGAFRNKLQINKKALALPVQYNINLQKSIAKEHSR